MDKLTKYLLQKKAHCVPLKESTTVIAEKTGMSQQNVSVRLIRLEEEGKIKRGKEGILITEKLMDEIKKEFIEIKRLLEEDNRITLKGKIEEGTKEGGYYLSLGHYRKEIKEKLGFEPYPGTLNIRINGEDIPKREIILGKEPYTISGFKTKERTFGEIHGWKAKIDGIDAVVILPLRTHYGKDMVEIIHRDNLQKILKKKNGDSVIIEVS
ncbi:DUF120 domain-containing protein [Candidatus Micrarchaeota archaeon]|nr:DUF120 domain-containing protein [Candidatus Micrarchaeota archaeon]